MPLKLSIELKGKERLEKALDALADPNAAYLTDAIERAGRNLTSAIGRRAPGGMGRAVVFGGVKGSPAGIRAVGSVKHPGALSMEFGRRSWTRQGQRVQHTPGQVARPIYGVARGDAAIGDVAGETERELTEAIVQTWEGA